MESHREPKAHSNDDSSKVACCLFNNSKENFPETSDGAKRDPSIPASKIIKSRSVVRFDLIGLDSKLDFHEECNRGIE